MKRNKLKENQLKLLRHLAQFESLDYLSCLRILDDGKTNDRTKLSYIFRPLTKNNYVKKYKDDSVRILSKGKALFPDINPLITIGGGDSSAKRINTVSRVAMHLKEVGINSYPEIRIDEKIYFIPSACWRKIRTSILSTTRFAGMLMMPGHRLAVYDIGDGTMEWQLRAERSLFYRNYGDFETSATGMLLICCEDKRTDVALQIIRETMWQRKQLLGNVVNQRDKPVKYVKSPIRLAAQYEHVYLTTPDRLKTSIIKIAEEERYITKVQNENPKCSYKSEGDYEDWPYRHFINITSDLLKYVYYFAAARLLMQSREAGRVELNYAIALPEHDFPILNMYPDIIDMEGMKFYECRDN